MSEPHFTRETFDFLRDLADNNERKWFEANRARYEEHVKDSALAFIFDFAPHLKAISPHFHAGPRSLFRIHRDVRFSKDKRPYKDHTGIQFRHDAGRDAHAPGWYLHLAPGEVFLGVGMWRPDTATLTAVREAMIEDPEAWRSVAHHAPFVDTFDLAGESLKRGPRGFDLNHPLIEDLKRKDLIGVRELDEAFVTAPELPARLARLCTDAAPFMRYLCTAVGVPF